MSSARLTALRLVGFKSFAERTVVEFGPGISAVVGPNGSGKSNLADALRWTLGEQGRMLRTRRSEDVIFAGSSSRRAIGMADVTLVIDNSDHLLPVDFGEIEIGRRLYRSGESEYLLNRQRIRLRDLVELLDAGNLADNAFLFIGQGMVDQALALRPEERRPLFEEAAGVRRHERRRRQAEAELVEAEANLDRVRDVLAELRPQARRLAAQAEQLQARRTAGLELAEGLLASAQARWLGSSETAVRQQRELERARSAADRALGELKAAEEEAATLSAGLGKRADIERAQRAELDRRRTELTELRVSAARIDSDLAALTRDAARLAEERSAIDSRLADATRQLSAAPVALAGAVDDELELVERQLSEIEEGSAPADTAQELRAQSAELDQQQRRRDATSRSLAEASARLEGLRTRLEAAEQERDASVAAARATAESVEQSEAALAAARHEVEQATAGRSAAYQRMSESESDLAAARARLAALDAALGGTDDGLARAARARGASLIGEGLEVDPRFRAALSALLGPAAGAYLVDEDAAPALAGRRGTLAVPVARMRPTAAQAIASVIESAEQLGGGRLSDAIRRDPQGVVTRLTERALWVPDLVAALRLRPSLPPGWYVATLDGELVSDEGLVELSSGQSVLDQRAARDATAREVADIEARLEEERGAYEKARAAAAGANERSQAVANELRDARGEQRRHDEAERVVQRRAEQLLRETAWEAAQVERLGAEVAAIEALSSQLASVVDRLRAEASSVSDDAPDATRREKRRAELRGRAAELRRERDERLAASRAAEDARRRAEIGHGLDETRLGQLEQEALIISSRLAEATRQRDDLALRIAATEEAVAATAVELDALLAVGADERNRLIAAERGAGDARERLRVAESTSRQAEMAAMEARLQLEQTREQLLVELATIGADGLRTLRQAAGLVELEADGAADSGVESDGVDQGGADGRGDDEGSAADAMEQLLDLVVRRWQTEPADRGTIDAPSAGRLASLRRRFNELGAGNPFAVDEYAEVRDRLETLESQRADMESAIESTRELIASLSALINEQFRTTFAALEGAFARRFHELFGGGDAELSLTVPEDISTTGIEIHARPPGKKRQPLSMLSGGERALTAVSLLLAMLEVRPVPFCVLDEVDAALDEANVGRFSKALRGLADQTQFIVITHNRGTIESADALYGVTLGDDAVSRVVSLMLPDAPGNGRSDGQDDREVVEAALN